MDCPTISEAVYPKSFSAAGFHVTTVPSRVLLTIASSLEAMMAAKWRASRSNCFVSVTSRAIFDAPMTVPSGALIGETVNEMSTRRPSFATRTVSK